MANIMFNVQHHETFSFFCMVVFVDLQKVLAVFVFSGIVCWVWWSRCFLSEFACVAFMKYIIITGYRAYCYYMFLYIRFQSYYSHFCQWSSHEFQFLRPVGEECQNPGGLRDCLEALWWCRFCLGPGFYFWALSGGCITMALCNSHKLGYNMI